MSNNPREAKMLSPSSAEDESCMERPRASHQGKENTQRDDTMCGDGGHVTSQPFRGMEDDREKMMWQCQDALNGAETEICSSHTVDTRHEQNEVKGHEDAQAQESNCDAEDFMEVLDATDGMSESHMIEINQSVGNGLEAMVQNDRSQASDYTLNRKLGDCDLAAQGTTPPSSVDDVVDMAADMDGSKAAHFSSSSSPPTLPSSTSLHTVANSSSAQLNTSSLPFDVPDIISTHEMGQALPAAPSQFSCTSAESRHLEGCCADAENDDCPKRDASIFTELVADVGGCLCSRKGLHDRLPRGWPDIFYPLPDLIASQHYFESQSHSSRGMTLGKTILVTGGAGYVGSHAVIEIVAAGYDVIVVDNLVNASMESIRRVEKIVGKKIITYSVDLLNKPALEEVFREHSIHAVIHFAGLKAVGESCEVPLLYYKTNVGGTTNLLEVMEAHEVYNLVFSSSATVYGKPQFLPLTESHPVGGCTSPYGKTKHMVEEMLCDIAAASKNWNFIILRYFNPVGAHKSGTIGEDPSGVPNNLMPFIGQVAVGRRAALKVYGNDYDTPDGTGVRDYIHVVDLAKGHVAALRKLEEGCSMKIYNLGTGRGCTVLEMVGAFEKASGKKIPYELAPRRLGDVPILCSDPSLAERELDWKAEKGLDEMCEDLWRWQSNNPHGYNEDAKK